MIETSYISAVAALAGTVAGCATSILTSWFTVRSQTHSQRTVHEKNSRRKLYDRFLDEASKIYIHALENSSTEVSKLVSLYATLNEIRVVSSPNVADTADRAVRNIIATYSDQNRTFAELTALLENGFPDPLQAFSEACRNELKRL